MIVEYKNRTEFLAWKAFGIRVIYTKKELGNVMEMPLSLLEKELNLPPKRIITGKQSHSDHIAIIREKEIFYFQDNDGFITDRKDIILYTKYADCMPVFLLDTTSKITAIRRTAPFTTYCQLLSRPLMDIPWLITPRRIAPTTTPPTVPLPPYAEAPPMKQEPIASISKELPVSPLTEPIRAAISRPERPASSDMEVYARTYTRSVLIPESMVASVLAPIA